MSRRMVCEIDLCQNPDVLPLHLITNHKGAEVAAYFGFNDEAKWCMKHAQFAEHLMDRRETILKAKRLGLDA